MKIKKIVINGFWQKYSFSFDADSDVNILSGVNGSGKTTCLNIIYSILLNAIGRFNFDSKYDSAEISFTNGFQLVVETKNNKKRLVCLMNGRRVSYDKFSQDLSYSVVCTFDKNLLTQDVKNILKEKFPWVDSELDYELSDALYDYHKYMSVISRELEKMVVKVSNPKDIIAQIRTRFEAISQMRSIFNELYADNLIWDEEAIEPQFILKDDNESTITPHELSSGEKQMLILLISTLVQDKKECIVFWDEPEISLHVDWQKALIRIMQKINPNMQLFIATHSPFIIYDGWENRVVNIKSLLHK